MKNKRRKKVILWLIPILIFSTSLFIFFESKDPIRADEQTETVSDLFFSKENSDEPIGAEQLVVYSSVTLTVRSLNETDEVVELELPEGITLNEVETLKRNGERQEAWLSQTDGKILINVKENEQHITNTKIVLEVKEIQNYQLKLTTERDEISYQSEPLNISREAITRTPRIGNLNLDLDISPVADKINSGDSASYKLNLKTTGSMTSYKNAQLVIELPKNSTFNQDLAELIIAGVRPVYNATNQTLTYVFPELTTGQAYQVTIRTTTINGTTPNDTKVTANATISADNLAKITDTAVITVSAATPISVTKSYVGVQGKAGNIGARPGDTLIWKVKASVNSNTSGLLFVKQGTQITISDSLMTGLTYAGTTSAKAPTQSNNNLTWTFDAPTLVSQQNSLTNNSNLWETEFLIYTKVASNVADFTKLTNKVDLRLTDFNNAVINKASNQTSTQIVEGGNPVETPSGSWYLPQYRGPSDALGNVTDYNPIPTVTDAARLQFAYSYNIGLWGEGVFTTKAKTTRYDFKASEVHTNGYKDISIHEEIDPNLIFDSIIVNKPKAGATNTAEIQADLKQMPTMTLRLQMNTVNNWVDVPIDTSRFTQETTWFELKAKELGILSTDRVLSYEIYYKNKDGSPIQGNFISSGLTRAYYTVKKGYVGKVTNRIWYSGWVDKAATPFYAYPKDDAPTSIIGPRSANVVSATTYTPVMRTSVKLVVSNGNMVEAEDNRINVVVDNDSSSVVSLNKVIQTMVLLPEGVTLKNTPNVNYLDSQGYSSENDPAFASGGSYTIVSNNYNNTNRQLVKVSWNDDVVRPRKYLAFGADVQIAETAPSPLNFEVYSFSGDPKLAVPTGGTTITDSYLEVDTSDINNDGNKTQNRVKSGNSYVLLRDTNVQTEKLVKGERDSVYSKFGHTVPGGKIDYQLKMTNTNNEPVTKFVLMDVLPSVGDLGITDGMQRGSIFTPVMTGPVTVPAEWLNKVTILYSTAVNPKRDDLIKNVIYPETTQKLTNPISATTPNWLTAAAVTDWSNIHSFKVELNSGVSWVKGQLITLDFKMKAPEESTITDKSMLDPSIDEKTRAAWNSFAYAQNTMQVIEPERVGIVMNGLGKVTIQKVDASNATTKLAGATFVIGMTEDQLNSGDYIKIDSGGSLVYPGDANYSAGLKNYEMTTNAQGAATFDQLRLDGSNGKKYYLKETKAPSGYQLLTKNIEVTASLEANPTVLSITNTKKITIPQTGSISLILILFIGIVFIGTGGMRYIKQQTKKETELRTQKNKKRRGNNL